MRNLEEILGAVVGLFFLVMWVINQIRDAKKQPAPRNQQPPPQPRQRQPRAQAPAGPAGQQADPLRDQVQDFLRRTHQQPPPEQQPMQRPAQRPPARRDPREIEVLVPEERPDDERRTIAQPFRPMQQSVTSGPAPAGPRPVTPRPKVEASRASVSEHVADHLGSPPVGWQASKLGQRIIADDAQFDVQLNAKFDHTIGTLSSIRLSDINPAQAIPSDTPASQIAALLASPAGVRQAIVLNEILRRPTDRW
jgi:hypothetical protein